MPTKVKTWFITGASSGLGKAFATYAVSKGHNVVATARSVEKLYALKADAPDRLLVCKLDVDHAGDAESAVAAAVERFGRIDVLINNAGYAIFGAVEETPERQLRAIMETNFFGAVAVTRAVLPVLRAQQSGAIVNISSMGGQMSFGGVGAYSATKFALEGISEALAEEVASFNIKVLIVEPGAFRTALIANMQDGYMPIMEAYRQIVGGTRDFIKGTDGAQAGDPMKAAAAVEMALNADKTPLRLQLGEDAITAIRGHAQKLLADLDAWKEIGLETRFNEAIV